MYIFLSNLIEAESEHLYFLNNFLNGKGKEKMKEAGSSWQNTAFLAAFIVLTLLVWCPLGYGPYGETGRIFAMPSWAFIALVLGVVLFVLEWIYLFHTNLSINDDDLQRIVAKLNEANTK